MSIQLVQPEIGDPQDLDDLHSIYEADPDALRQLPSDCLPAQPSAEALLAAAGLEVHAIRFNSRLVAAGCCWPANGDTLRIGALAVRPSSRGRGLPQRLVQGLVARLDGRCHCLEVLQPTLDRADFAPQLPGYVAEGPSAPGMQRFRRSS